MATIFRPLYKSLPEQPYASNAFQSWTYSYNLSLIGQDRLPTGAQFWERPTLPIPPLAPTWIQTQFPVLLMQPAGRPVVGSAWFDLPPNPIPYRIDQTWTRSYNLNLIGQDRLPVGKIATELPPRDYQRPQDIRTWLQTTTALTLTPPPVVRPIVQSDWPLPQIPARLDQFWSETFQQTPPPVDTINVRRPIWRSLPDQGPPKLDQTWTQPLNLNLISAPPDLTKQARQQHWPNPVAPYRLDQTYTASYNLNLIGKDRLPTGAQVSELPPRDFPRLFQTWINTANLSLVTAPPDLTRQVHIFDYPNPRGAEPDWRRSWEFSYNKNLIGQDQLPFRQQDWPLTRAVDRAGEWIQQTALALTAVAPRPFVQSDWPNPTQPFRDPTLRAWAPPLNIGLLAPQPLLPPLYLRNQDWPNPRGPIYPSDLRAWPIQGSPAPIIPGVPPPPPVGPAVYNKPMLAGPGYLNVIPGEKPS